MDKTGWWEEDMEWGVLRYHVLIWVGGSRTIQ